MSDWRAAYYAETIADALENAGCVVAPEVITQVAEAVAISVENEGMASGRDCIPNPENTEIASLKRQLVEQRAEAERAEEVWRHAAARVTRTDPKHLYRRGRDIIVDAR